MFLLNLRLRRACRLPVWRDSKHVALCFPCRGKQRAVFYYFEFPCIRIQGIRKAQMDSDLAAETEDLAKRLPDGAAIEVVEAEHGQTSLLNLSLEDVTIVTDL